MGQRDELARVFFYQPGQAVIRYFAEFDISYHRGSLTNQGHIHPALLHVPKAVFNPEVPIAGSFACRLPNAGQELFGIFSFIYFSL